MSKIVKKDAPKNKYYIFHKIIYFLFLLFEDHHIWLQFCVYIYNYFTPICYYDVLYVCKTCYESKFKNLIQKLDIG